VRDLEWEGDIGEREEIGSEGVKGKEGREREKEKKKNWSLGNR
jgi:hypothetical protein